MNAYGQDQRGLTLQAAWAAFYGPPETHVLRVFQGGLPDLIERLVLFIYRDEVYDPDSAKKGIAELIIGKQRNGPIGMVELRFVGGMMKFENYIDGSRYDETPEG